MAWMDDSNSSAWVAIERVAAATAETEGNMATSQPTSGWAGMLLGIAAQSSGAGDGVEPLSSLLLGDGCPRLSGHFTRSLTLAGQCRLSPGDGDHHSSWKGGVPVSGPDSAPGLVRSETPSLFCLHARWRACCLFDSAERCGSVLYYCAGNRGDRVTRVLKPDSSRAAVGT